MASLSLLPQARAFLKLAGLALMAAAAVGTAAYLFRRASAIQLSACSSKLIA
jgi:hypothetical protein